MYVNDTPQATGVHLALFADDTCLYATERKEGYGLCRKQAKIIQNHGSANVRNIGQGEPRHRKFKRFKLGGG
jgi:hypothetical protein